MAQPSSSPFPPAVEVIEDFPLQYSSPLSLRKHPCPSPHAPPATNLAHTYNYNFSGSVYDETTSGAEVEDPSPEPAEEQEEDLLDTERRISGCSSISSFPASVSQHLSSRQSQYGSPSTPSKPHAEAPQAATSPTGMGKPNSPFRHPSSIRALQMRDEVLSDTQSVLRHHRYSGSQRSSSSRRTAYSPRASAKRSFRSSGGSPNKANSSVKTEFPLVLLHCTLLPPALLSQSTAQEDLIVELLPEEYKRRWTTLREKLVGDVEVRTRGILIPHPKEDYDLLEERLLESLDLQHPRIRHDHYFQADPAGTDSGFESGSLTGDEVEQDRPHDKCPDCGRPVNTGEVTRKWDVKVFAANGLMRAGAWAAAWQEMEKVDVEIRVWLPQEMRRDLEDKLALLGITPPEVIQQENAPVFQDEHLHARETEVYGEPGRHRGLSNFHPSYDSSRPQESTVPVPVFASIVELSALMLGYARGFRHGRKPILIGILSFLVLLFAWDGRTTSPDPNAFHPVLDPSRLTNETTRIGTATSEAGSIATVTVTTSVSIQVPCVPGYEAHSVSTSASGSQKPTPVVLTSEAAPTVTVKLPEMRHLSFPVLEAALN
ncbi:hypothetical protein A1O1_07023 [Capronia coronata CBS 617.96]|uniref:Uncharacterized protein n=1 Tax=Capronia coronata CBS 617.96 TaxID=1182541 RepID=W9Y2G0_9EURO|nr:uncharacterized protein A1O1_07023 [Capronia coronata CBS 617.96]EXJ83401.1 hypothetical protein A1O1_07023 [Capronia coronata CBS 617.96]